MKTYSDPIEAAFDLYGIMERGTHSHDTARLREFLKESPGPLRAMQMAYGEVMPASAFLCLSGTFGGRANAAFTKQANEPQEREGFYAMRSESFHADSVKFEDLAARTEETSREACKYLIGQGVNICQAADLLPMGECVSVIFMGDLLDFADLYEEHGRIDKGSHPAARQFVLDVWADITSKHKAFAEAHREAHR